MAYVDGFVLPIAVEKVDAYKKMAKKASKVWMEHGALAYHECVGDDLNMPGMLSFAKIAKAKEGETVIFAWIVYASKSQRNKINAKVMKDPRLAGMMDMKDMPFNVKRMAYGGFKTIVEG